jgi:polyisoprenoid-binding protein YceI
MFRPETTDEEHTVTTASPSTVTTWNIDASHTIVGYAVSHLGISTYRGKFKTVEGVLHINEDNPAASSVSATIDAGSLDIPQDRFYGHIVSPDFLDVQNHPKITFQSTNVEKVADDKWKVAGNLTLRGVTKEVVLDTTYLGQAEHPFSKNTHAAFTAETEINREDFGLKWNAPLVNGGVYLGERIRLSLDIEAIKQV